MNFFHQLFGQIGCEVAETSLAQCTSAIVPSSSRKRLWLKLVDSEERAAHRWSPQPRQTLPSLLASTQFLSSIAPHYPQHSPHYCVQSCPPAHLMPPSTSAPPSQTGPSSQSTSTTVQAHQALLQGSAQMGFTQDLSLQEVPGCLSWWRSSCAAIQINCSCRIRSLLDSCRSRWAGRNQGSPAPSTWCASSLTRRCSPS